MSYPQSTAERVENRPIEVCGKGIRIDGRAIRIGRLEADRFEFLDDPEAALKEIRHSGIRMDLFSFVQKLRDRQPRYSYPLEWDNLAALPVSTFDHWWTKQIDNKTRNMVRRAEKKGVTVREVQFDDMLVRGISEVYNESPIRQGKPFWHYQKSLDAVRRANGTFVDRSIFITASLGDGVIGFAKLVADEDRQQAALMQILSMVAHRDKSPTNALIAQAVRSCAERGIPYLVYASFAYDNKLRDSLSDFKQHNGFQRIDVPRYYVPLTMRGRIALRLGLHHPITTHIPEPVLARLRAIRGWWFGRSMRTANLAEEPSNGA
jgi:hypothetical protein